MRWISAVIREALTLTRLHGLPPSEAAAVLVALRDTGVTPAEAQVMAQWLSADPAHQAAYEAADGAWQAFDHADDHEILAAMRAHARAPRRALAPGWP